MYSFDDYHYYHGAALNVIAENENFTSINKVPGIKSRYAYLLNHNTTLFIKHSTLEGNAWKFIFAPDHQEVIRKLYDNYKERTFIILVCKNIVCLLTYGEYRYCIDENFKEQEWLEVRRPDGGGFRVRGAKNELGNVVPLNRFPGNLF